MDLGSKDTVLGKGTKNRNIKHVIRQEKNLRNRNQEQKLKKNIILNT